MRHLNKNPGQATLYRGAGAMAFLALCRSAWLFARDPARPARTVIAHLKNNLAPPQNGLAYEVITHDEAVPELIWHGASELTAGNLLKWASRAYPARLRARDFLNDILQDGPKPTSLIWEAALKAGLSRITLKRAKKDLAIRVCHVLVEGKNVYFWLFEHQKPPLSTDPHVRAFEQFLEDMRTTIPPQNPLDETS